MLYQTQTASSLLRRLSSCFEFSIRYQSCHEQAGRFQIGRLQLGLSAVEFLIILAAASIVFVSVLAGASQRNERWLVDDSARNLQLSLAFARNQAITRRSSVRVCPASEQLDCNVEGDWNRGWMVVDMDSNEVLRFSEPGPTEVQLFADPGVNRYVQFNMRGDAYGTAGEFVFCHQYQQDYSAGLQVSAVGLVEHMAAVNVNCEKEG